LGISPRKRGAPAASSAYPRARFFAAPDGEGLTRCNEFHTDALALKGTEQPVAPFKGCVAESEAYIAQEFCGRQDGRRQDETFATAKVGFAEQVFAQRPALDRAPDRPDHVATLSTGNDTATYDGQSVPRAQGRVELNLELLRQPFVVVIKQRDPSSQRNINTGVAGSPEADVLA
jgi:hypothetical protein